MNYYIQGDAAKADQIKAAFSKFVSIQEMAECDFSQEEYLFYTGQEERGTFVYSTWVDGINANIIKTHPDYQELELPVKSNPKFKPGTWLWHKTKGVFPIMVEDYYEKEGYLMQYPESKCYFGRDIIENDYRLWNFGDSKLGDILYDKAYNRIGIFENFGHHPDGGSFNDKTYCYLILYYDVDDNEFYEKTCNDMDGYDAVPATKEQRDLLFQKMKEAGYQWDADKKELKKIQPHYNISNFKPKQWVLARDTSEWDWELTMFAYLNSDGGSKFTCINGVTFKQCIPFNEKTEHLLGTTDMCPEEYINWQND